MAQNLKLNRANTASLLAEFLGTSVLVMLTLVLTQTTAVSYFIGTSVALALGVAYMMFGSISGGHFNPAITLGVWVSNKITQSSSIKAVSYIAAQMLGAVASWQLYQYLINQKLTSQTVAYSFPILLAEAVGALVLALGFSAATKRTLSALESALTYGFSLFVAVMIASTASAGLINPAVALGVRNFNWVYVVGPAVGAIIGIVGYKFLFAASTESSSRVSEVKVATKSTKSTKKTTARRRK